MEVTYQHFVLFILITFAPPCATTAITSKQPMVLKLVHLHSSNSPYYEPNATAYDLADKLIASSLARYDYIAARTKNLVLASEGGIQASIHTVGIFLVDFAIGEPPVNQLAIMDTGSSLLWIQCQPCKRCAHRLFNRQFDPATSFTYSYLPCDSCGRFDFRSGCINYKTECEYVIQYADGDNSTGVLAREKLTFYKNTKSNVLFGCGQTNYIQDGLWNGVLGLNAGKSSLVSQIGSKFSYCIGRANDNTYPYNWLIIGDEAYFAGSQTRFEIYQSHYYLSLIAISVEETSLNINPTVFQRDQYGQGGVIMDSGTFMTILPREALEPLRSKVEDLMANVLRRVTYNRRPELLCFQGVASRDLKGFPLVTLHFEGGADLDLEADSLFFQPEKNILCMAVTLSTSRLTIIGVLAQQYYNIGYDLDTKYLFFLRMDCSIIEGE